MHTTMPSVRLSKRDARIALRHIDELQPCMPSELDWQDCVLMAPRGRLRDTAREVPAGVWPEIKEWLGESPGLMKNILPHRTVRGQDAIDLAFQVMEWHVWAMLTLGVDPMAVLISEGLLNALMVDGQTTVGPEMADFLDNVRQQQFRILTAA